MSAQDVIALSSNPTDGITCVRFSKCNAEHLLVSSWDCSVRVYDVANNRLRLKMEIGNPVMATCYGADKSTAYSAGLDGSVVFHNLDQPSNTHPSIGSHAKAVSALRFDNESGRVFSGSWDATVATWDPKSSSKTPTARMEQLGKVYSMSMHGHTIAVGTSAKKVALYDLRRTDEAFDVRDSPLKYQIRWYVVSTTEGRVGLEYLDTSKKGYAFKCHRQKVDENDTLVYPVNTVAFHPTLGTFATGGCDGVVNVWDGENKKRLCQLAKFSSSIASMDFNHDGSKIAVASSYTFEEGPKDHEEDTVYIRTIQDVEVRPKTRET
ncbi:mitotic checkpoint protein BUB3-like [Thraustotheca clavata]|uniref:Mitotic checkpoint protein BUB3-like n=1 Tax=Thraustotheca clavata TaxID=74557 RepID=A0A1V9YSG2_9STRA|nr:mitotic checkpoint protein BUB3-like [Thraustotheca clavata]